MRVLMLGWEYPPLISGGLGTACQGIVGGLVAAGAEVIFVAPRLCGAEDARGAELVAAGDVSEGEQSGGPGTRGTRRGTDRGPGRGRARGNGSVRQAFVPSLLAPYQSRASYRELLLRLRKAERRADPVRAAHLVPFEGGYGASLPSEVERYARAVAEIARRGGFDVIHAHDWMTFPAGEIARRVSGRPLVFHVHSCEHDRSQGGADPEICAVEQAALDAADAVVCVSGYTRSVLAKHYRLHLERARVVHNAVEHDPARNGAARARARPKGAAPTVLFLGRLTRPEGARLLPAGRRGHRRAARRRALRRRRRRRPAREPDRARGRTGPRAARVLHRLPAAG
jgi:glycosyltransferase involved in cell wall biosynthesis